MRCSVGYRFVFLAAAFAGLGSWTQAGAPIKVTQVSKIPGPEIEKEFGIAVAGAGDVDGDGFADVIVSSRDRHYLYRGGLHGLMPAPIWSFQGLLAGESEAMRAVGTGDVNGDGFDDLLVGDISYPGGGRGLVFQGSPAGPGTSHDWSVLPFYGGSGLGFWVSAGGDVDGDGYDDALISQREGSMPGNGVVALFHGSATGLGSTPDWIIEGGEGIAEYGRGLSSVGDLDADGFDDIMVGAPGTNAGGVFNAGTVFVFFGSATGLEPTAGWSIQGADANNPYGNLLGRMVRGAGDVDGDGYGELLIGDDLFTPGDGGLSEGQATLTYGTPDGLEPGFTWHTRLHSDGSGWGHDVAGLGDVDADGYDDFVVGGHLYVNVAGGRKGFVRLFAGSPLGPIPAWQRFGENPEDLFSDGLAAVGDVNGDGRPDFVVGSPLHFVSGEERGAAYLFSACVEADDDAVCDFVDNCPGTANLGQSDGDLDGAGDACDCAPGNDQVWAHPGPVSGLEISADGGGVATLNWSPPPAPGGSEALTFDLLRTPDPGDFQTQAVCLAVSDGGTTASALDAATPAVGQVQYYLARARNSCGAGLGALGAGSDGAVRDGRACP